MQVASFQFKTMKRIRACVVWRWKARMNRLNAQRTWFDSFYRTEKWCRNGLRPSLHITSKPSCVRILGRAHARLRIVAILPTVLMSSGL